MGQPIRINESQPLYETNNLASVSRKITIAPRSSFPQIPVHSIQFPPPLRAMDDGGQALAERFSYVLREPSISCRFDAWILLPLPS